MNFMYFKTGNRVIKGDSHTHKHHTLYVLSPSFQPAAIES